MEIDYTQNDFVKNEKMTDDDDDDNSMCPGPESIVDEQYKISYENRMIRNANKNCQVAVFKPGTDVYLKKDTEGNPRYQIKGIETFSHEEIFVIFKLDDDNHIWIRKKNSDDEPFRVHKNRLFFNKKYY